MLAFALNASAQVNPKIEKMADALEDMGKPMSITYSHWDNLTVSYSTYFNAVRYLNSDKVKPNVNNTIREIVLSTLDDLCEDATEIYRKETHYDSDTLNCYMTLGKSNTEKVHFYASSVFPVNDNALLKCKEQTSLVQSHPTKGEYNLISGSFHYSVILDTINKPTETFRVKEYKAAIKPVLKGYKKAKIYFHHKATDKPVLLSSVKNSGKRYIYSQVSHTNGTPTYDTETRGYVYFIPKEKVVEFKKRMNEVTESFLRSYPQMEFDIYSPNSMSQDYIGSALGKKPNEIVEYVYPRVPKNFDVFFEKTNDGLFVAVTETSGDRWLENKWYEDYYKQLGIKK